MRWFMPMVKYPIVFSLLFCAQTAMKGKINVCKAKGDTIGAIKGLSAYSRIYSGDKEVWQELAELYISQAK